MKNEKLPKPVKRSLWAFLLFALIIIIGRHVVADQSQQTRIETLETQIEQLEKRIDAQGQKLAEIQNKTPATPAEPRRRTTPKEKKTERTVVTAAKQLSEVLTEERKRDKFTTPVLLELNTIDSATLVKVPGIAERTASTILSYRQRLGGFYSPEQLREHLTWEAAQKHMDEWCTQWFKADESLVQMLQINSLSFKEINRHPYISYEQTKALVRYRDKHKGIHKLTELEQLEEFDEATLEKLKHYISFE